MIALATSLPDRAGPLDSSTFRIEEASVRVLKAQPLAVPFQDGSMGPFFSAGLATVTLRDEEGNEGEAPVVDLATLENLLLPILLGRNAPTKYQQLYHALYWSIRNSGFRGPAAGAVGAVDLALHDLAARRSGKPLHRFLGATRDWARVYASGGSTHLTLPDLVQEMASYAEAGYSTVKMKVGRNFGREPDEDLRRIRGVRAMLGDKIGLAVDANQVWTSEAARNFARAAADLGIAWFEEPVFADDLAAINAVCADSPVPIAMGESEHCERLFPYLVEVGVAHIQTVYHRLPGVRAFQRIQALPSACFSSGGFSHYAAQLVATGEEDGMTEFLLATNVPLEARLSHYPRVRNGRFELPEIAGIGMRVDWPRAMREGQCSRMQRWTRADFSTAQVQL